MQLHIQPTLDGEEPAYSFSSFLHPDWLNPGYWKLHIRVYPADKPTGPPVADAVYDSLTFEEAGDVLEATLRGIPLR